MSFGKIQMALFAAVAAAVTVGSFAYIFIARPAYLHATRDGVPYLTPPSSTRSTARPWMWACWYAISLERTAAMTLDLETIAQIVMFFVAFYLIYLCLTQDVF